MKTLVTGATGFIGSHIVDHLLEQGDIVQALVRPNSNTQRLKQQGVYLVEGDLFDVKALNLATENIDVVFHAAALLDDISSDGKSIYDVNVNGVKNLLDACVQNQVERIVFISSVAAYASSRDTFIGEDTSLGGRNIYGHTKAEAEMLIKFYGDSFGLSYSIIRPCVIYGERDHNFTPRLLNLLRRQFVPIVAGDTTHMVLVHAADVAQATILAGSHPKAIGQAYNIANGFQTSLKELVKIYEELLGQQKHLVPIPKFLLRGVILTRSLISSLYKRQLKQAIADLKNGNSYESVFLRNHYYDIGKARRELGFEPKIELKEGLRRALVWRDSSLA